LNLTLNLQKTRPVLPGAFFFVCGTEDGGTDIRQFDATARAD